MKNLIFFDKEGYALNFKHNDIEDRYEGKMFFDQNSSDTFKTLVINTFERIPAFEYSQANDLDLSKFQLFNDKGLEFKAYTRTSSFNSISKVNSSPDFYSKWVYGYKINTLYPVGTEIYFTGTGNTEFEPTISPISTFTVASVKNNAIMIITVTNNQTYIDVPVTGTITSLNIIQVNDYLSLPAYSQPGFQSSIYTGRKISIINSTKNNGVYTIGKLISAKSLKTHNINPALLTSAGMSTDQHYIQGKVKLHTDRIFVSSESVIIDSIRKSIKFTSVPDVLTVGSQFVIDDQTSLNYNITFEVRSLAYPNYNPAAVYVLYEVVEYLNILYINTFAGNTGNQPSNSPGYWQVYNKDYVATVIYRPDNIILYRGTYYRSLTTNTGILPDSSTTDWTKTLTKVYILQTPISETTSGNGTMFLTTTEFLFKQFWNGSDINTMVAFVRNNYNAFYKLNLLLEYSEALSTITCRNRYTYNAIDVLWTTKVGNIVTIIDGVNSPIPVYMMNVTEQIKTEFASFYTPYESPLFNIKHDSSYISENFEYNIMFTGIDSFGLHVTINGLQYSIPFDTNDTITLADWITTHAATLLKLGIVVTSVTNTLTVKSSYPNMLIDVEILLGSTATYEFEHSTVTFNTNPLFTVLSMVINDITYSVPFDTSIANTVSKWKNTYVYELLSSGIIVKSSGSTLSFSTINQTILDGLKYNVYTGHQFTYDRNDNYSVVYKKYGNTGIIIASNQILNTNLSEDLQTKGFATAMITHIKGSTFPLNNQEYNIIGLDPNNLTLSYQGPFWQDLTSVIVLQTREFIRQPRFGFDTDTTTKYKFRWLDDTTPEIFFYDFSGNNLATSGPFAYTGMLPLMNESNENDTDNRLVLNKIPNTDLSRVSIPKYQQTVFPELVYNLDKVDSSTDLTFEPEPFQTFFGFNAKDEGIKNNIVIGEMIEDISLNINTNPSSPTDIINFNADDMSINIISSTIFFTNYNFRAGQIISIHGYDNTNSTNQAKFLNNGKKFLIKNVYTNAIILDFFDESMLSTESSLTSIINPLPPFNIIPTGITVTLKVEPKEFIRVNLYGQTEIEDARFRIQLDNVGHNIKHRDVYIFKQYDIKENGIDWIYLNRKRKEMLQVQPEIFNYVGAYRALVNAINYFGYNDLELYEYYRNINPNSANYKKLQKMEIPDIFDNTIPGWNEKDYIKNTLPNKNFEKTKLFNLTYRITDVDGNNIQAYSLDEAIVKLSGLKKWIQENVIPQSTKILDITGRADTSVNITVQHSGIYDRCIKDNETLDPVTFKAGGYLQPINPSGLYNIHLDFSTMSGLSPDAWQLNIRTYETYPYWSVNNPYNIGDKIIFLGRIYQSQSVNKALEPIRFTNDWKEVPFQPIQNIDELKTDLASYNFGADKNVDPFVVITATSYNNRGASFAYKKYYSLDGVFLLTDKGLSASIGHTAFDGGFDNSYN